LYGSKKNVSVVLLARNAPGDFILLRRQQGNLFDEMTRNFEWQREELASHVCADPRARNIQPGEDKTISMTSDRETTTADWRELARRIQKEEDPEKVFELVQQLVIKFDEESRRKGPATTQKVENPRN